MATKSYGTLKDSANEIEVENNEPSLIPVSSILTFETARIIIKLLIAIVRFIITFFQRNMQLFPTT